MAGPCHTGEGEAGEQGKEVRQKECHSFPGAEPWHGGGQWVVGTPRKVGGCLGSNSFSGVSKESSKPYRESCSQQDAQHGAAWVIF